MSTSSGNKGLSIKDKLSAFFASSQKASTAQEPESTKPVFNAYVNKTSNVYAENKILRGLFVGIFVVVIYNTYQIDNLKNTRVERIIPIGQSVEYTFIGNAGSDEYLRSMAIFILQLCGDLSAGSARSQLALLQSFWHPTTAADYRDRFKTMSDEIEKFPSTSFDVTWDAAKPVTYLPGEVRIHAIKHKLIGSKIEKSSPIEYKIEYLMENGRFAVTHIKEVGAEQ